MKTLIATLLGALALSHASTSFAAKEVFQRTKPHVNVGTIGHVDSGKTLLVLATAQAAGIPIELTSLSLTGGDDLLGFEAETQAAAEDNEPGLAGVTIYLDLNRNNVSLYDFENDGAAVNLMTGEVPLQGVILVVDATDGPMPQTKEHILLARQVGVPISAIYINVHTQTTFIEAHRAEAATREILSAAGLDGERIPAVRGSVEGAWQGDKEDILSLADLLDAVDAGMAR